MTIIKIEKEQNGWHQNISGSVSNVPDGWALLPDSIQIPETFPFINIEVDEIDGIMTVTSMKAGAKPTETLDNVKANKRLEVDSACKTAITDGVDVELPSGTEHFSLQETDQINLTTAYNAVQSGLSSYPYHADGKLCRMFTADEISAISKASIAHKLYHTTLCNHLLTWIRRIESVEELQTIVYSPDVLPSDLADNMVKILEQASSIEGV